MYHTRYQKSSGWISSNLLSDFMSPKKAEYFSSVFAIAVHVDVHFRFMQVGICFSRGLMFLHFFLIANKHITPIFFRFGFQLLEIADWPFFYFWRLGIVFIFGDLEMMIFTETTKDCQLHLGLTTLSHHQSSLKHQ